MSAQYPRQMFGYGPHGPGMNWPDGARVAVQIVVNYEEGGENCVLHGDRASETFLSEIIGAQPVVGARHANMESLYEYGSRRGFWRLLRVLTERNIPATVFGVAMALERNPHAVEAMMDAQWEIASHGYRWIDYQHFPEAEEVEHMMRAIEIQKRLTGKRPLGWYTGRSSPNTRRLVAAEGGFRYSADSYADDFPYWEEYDGRALLVVPYTLDVNDARFVTNQGYNSGEQFFQYLKDAFDTHYAEGARDPQIMSIGLHCRLIGRPARLPSLERFLDYAQRHSGVWFCRRIDIAEHCHRALPCQPQLIVNTDQTPA
ncbi:allantoinase PuuE [Paraburkholderia sp. LEh10]|uniref:allantoinase PuuE n=1 Tax=Paraburkholderia sp. LEh10 TaxID=2821353 RepID=UPI001AEB1B6A|nr:allantoinase PuuE [Paraburkholderia sp. LEh10]MBP0588401.1 allantoinase PuuE [Paraburkholderia sp. LEh10]